MGWFKLWAPSGVLDSRSYGAASIIGAIGTPTADVEEVTVPGKNGAVIIPQNRWNNIERSYELWLDMSNWATVVAALQSCANGYYMLEDSWNTGRFYQARFVDLEVGSTTPLAKKAVLQITFDCQPQRWSTSGAAWVDTRGQTGRLYNTSAVLSAPTALKLCPMYPPSSGSSFKADLEFSFFKPTSDEAYGTVKIAAEWPTYGNLVIDSLTHDIYYDSEFTLTPGGVYVPPTPAWDCVTITTTGTPPQLWPEIPPGESLEIYASNKIPYILPPEEVDPGWDYDWISMQYLLRDAVL